MTKIAIIGIGGVGGYFGGLLAKHFAHSNDVEVYFIAKGEHLNAIATQGLTLETTHGNFTVWPKLATSNPAEIGPVDLVVYCTKSYDLEESLAQIKPCVNDQTAILPLLNGVDSHARIKAVYPDNEVWDGCVYLVARLISPGLVRETGTLRMLYLGAREGAGDKILHMERLFQEAGIQATYSSDILSTIWEKYVFISALGAITSYHDTIIGDLLPDPQYTPTLMALLSEISAVAKAEGIPLGEDIIERTMGKFAAMPYGTMSSMHSDFQKRKSTEVHSLLGYVVNLGSKHNIPVSTYEMMYEKLTLSFGHYLIRPLLVDDSIGFFHLINNNLDRFERYFPFTIRETATLEDAKKHVANRVARAEKKEYYSFVIVDKTNQEIAGVVSLKDVDWSIPKCEFAYFIDRHYEGKGIVSKCVSLLIYYCFKTLKINKVFMRIQEDNLPSRRVAEKNGFAVEGVLRRDFKSSDGELLDSVYYGLLR